MARTGNFNINDPLLMQAALEGLLIQKQRIDEQIQQVRTKLGMGGARRGRPPGAKAAVSAAASTSNAAEAAPAKRGRKRRRKLSPEARKRIAAAQKKRWAAYHKDTPAKA